MATRQNPSFSASLARLDVMINKARRNSTLYFDLVNLKNYMMTYNMRSASFYQTTVGELPGEHGNTMAYTSPSSVSIDPDSEGTRAYSGGAFSMDEIKRKLDIHAWNYPESSWETGVEIEQYRNFNRFYTIYPNAELGPLRQYCFLVRPALNLLSDWSDKGAEISQTFQYDPFVKMMVAQHPQLVKQLVRDTYTHDFIPWLVGRTETCSLPETVLTNEVLTQPYTGYQMPYGGNIITSRTGGTLNMSFREDAKLRTTLFFSLWLYYMDAVKRNTATPLGAYIQYNKCDYASSLYYLVCDATGENILYWGKYTGIFPLNVPTNVLSFNRGDTGTSPKIIDIQFSYFYYEDLLPEILIDFNNNSYIRGGGTNPIGADKMSSYDPDVAGSGNAIAGAPYIEWPGITTRASTDHHVQSASVNFKNTTNPKLRWQTVS
jgi:hypothetical protein